MSDWRPIETAPKDGKEIIVWQGEPDGWAMFAHWHSDFLGWHASDYTVEDPTHWMPAPEKPE